MGLANPKFFGISCWPFLALQVLPGLAFLLIFLALGLTKSVFRYFFLGFLSESKTRIGFLFQELVF